MGEFFLSIDSSLFVFINTNLSNPFFDAIMPAFTDWNRTPIGVGIIVSILIYLNWKGGRKGRIITLLIVVLILCSDQFSSSVLKPLIARPRPCHELEGVRMIRQLRLLVDCGSGFSFPSSHAVNNAALALLFSYYYRRTMAFVIVYAFVIGLSRVIVGVHYPFDIIGGWSIGVGVATLLIYSWKFIGARVPFLAISPEPSSDGIT